MQGVRYGEMLKSARMFTRMGEGVAGVPCTGLSSGQTPLTTSATTVDSNTAPSTAGMSIQFSGGLGTADGDIDPSLMGDDADGLFNGISFEELLGAYPTTDILAS